MTELKYLRDAARTDYIENRLNKYPTLKDYIGNKIEESAKSGHIQCIIEFETADEADFAMLILSDSDYSYDRVLFKAIQVNWK